MAIIPVSRRCWVQSSPVVFLGVEINLNCYYGQLQLQSPATSSKCPYMRKGGASTENHPKVLVRLSQRDFSQPSETSDETHVIDITGCVGGCYTIVFLAVLQASLEKAIHFHPCVFQGFLELVSEPMFSVIDHQMDVVLIRPFLYRDDYLAKTIFGCRCRLAGDD